MWSREIVDLHRKKKGLTKNIIKTRKKKDKLRPNPIKLSPPFIKRETVHHNSKNKKYSDCFTNIMEEPKCELKHLKPEIVKPENNSS